MGNFEINIDPPQPSGDVVEIRGGGPSRGALAIVFGLVIVVVLVVAVGRSRDKTIAEPSTTTSLFEPTTTTTDGSSTTTSTTSEPATTTTVAALQVFGPLLPEKTGATLVVARADGRLVQVDVDSGTVTDLAPGQRLRNATYQLLVLKNAVVVIGDQAPSFVAGGAITPLQFAVDQVLGSPDGIQVIGVRYSETGPQVVGFIPGASPGPTISFPPQSDPIALVPGGIVLQSRAGGVYRLDLADGGVRQIADGTLVAIAGDRVASITCDETLKCGIGLGPLGKRPQHSVAVPELFSWYYGQGGNALSPTRDLMAFETNVAERLTVAVLDLDTGSVVLSARVSTGPQGFFSPLVWSPDGRWLFWVDLGKVMAWSPDRGGDPIEFANTDAGAAEIIAAAYAA